MWKLIGMILLIIFAMIIGSVMWSAAVFIITGEEASDASASVIGGVCAVVALLLTKKIGWY